MYSLHRGACSRGLHAGRERELAPGLCELQRVLLEILISCSDGVCVLQSVVRGLHWLCLLLFARVASSLGAALVTPFYSRREAQGRYMYLLHGVLRQGWHVRALQLVTVAAWSVERSCPPCTGATRRSRLIPFDVGAPVVAGAPSSVGGVLVTVCLTGVECRDRVDAMARVC